MSKFPALTPVRVIRALERAGFEFIRQKGSHKIYAKENKLITVPFHNKDIKKGTLRNIIRQSGLAPEKFIDLL